MLKPPGALLRYLIGGWSQSRVEELVRKLALSPEQFEKLLLGALPFTRDFLPIVAHATGVSVRTFDELEQEFTDWCGSIASGGKPAGGFVRDPNIRSLFSGDEIIRRVGALALEMNTLPHDDLLIIPILKGAFIFSADLIRFLFSLGIDPGLEFWELSSYRQGHSPMEVVENGKSLRPSLISDRSVLIIDDICDSGSTLDYAQRRVMSFGAKRVYTCVLLDKDASRMNHLKSLSPNYVGFKVPPLWVVGYGMDDDEKFRGSPDVGELSTHQAC